MLHVMLCNITQEDISSAKVHDLLKECIGSLSSSLNMPTKLFFSFSSEILNIILKSQSIKI